VFLEVRERDEMADAQAERVDRALATTAHRARESCDEHGRPCNAGRLKRWGQGCHVSSVRLCRSLSHGFSYPPFHQLITRAA
jgi:hypothetical protein